jgi:hypothetical protein
VIVIFFYVHLVLLAERSAMIVQFIISCLPRSQVLELTLLVFGRAWKSFLDRKSGTTTPKANLQCLIIAELSIRQIEFSCLRVLQHDFSVARAIVRGGG